MTDSKMATAESKADAFDSLDAKLSRGFAIGLPIVTVTTAIGVGFASSIGPAILVLAAGMLLGVIALFWASLRILSGEAPVDGDLVAARRIAAIESAEERKRILLRYLKDLEHEHAIGKIDDEDYQDLVAHYRSEAVALMRELDAEVAPVRGKAEELVEAFLAARGLAENAGGPSAAAASTTRLPCPKCATSNEPDATFCKSCGTKLGAQADAT